MFDHHSGALYNAAPFLVVRVNRDGERKHQTSSKNKNPQASKVVIVEEVLDLASITDGKVSRFVSCREIHADVWCSITVAQFEKLSYRLFACVQHFGSATQGHYAADILQGQQWRRYNDDLPPVTASSPSGRTCTTFKRTDGTEVPQWAPAILFYQLVERKECGEVEAREAVREREDVEAREEVEKDVKEASLALSYRYLG
jgi:hypothetical protein